ncbi:glycosyl hydrolase family 8 [Oenococcus oeni]|uniref:Glucanase n=1 Tax=Oenococcus oeni TaxID=1247 RepID=A0AAQ2US98_OENOE|nr:glycosyl hydrolase family 8 [Oenococcus oeni]KGI02502.1 hypothetical protein X293_03490 [Oenococcus oeni IOEB_C52]SYW05281.1 Glucanase [Oenococcus oeni]VDB98778.1 Glucanase [Oenococcus oeni]
MKKQIFRWICMISIATIYIIVLLFVRLSSTRNLQVRLYDQWKKIYVVSKNGRSFVNVSNRSNEKKSLSESQGYGMLVTFLAAEKGYASKKDFDEFFKYYETQIDKKTGLVSWEQIEIANKIKKSSNDSTEGDLLIADALIQASEKWPNSKNNYRKAAKKILNAVLRNNYNRKLHILTIGNWAEVSSHYNSLIQTSDVMPIQFSKFYKVTGDSRWNLIKKTMLKKLLYISNNNKTGLLPDFAWVSGSKAKPVRASQIVSKYDGSYYYYASKIPMNLAGCSDARSKKILHKLMMFFSKENNITAGYKLNGKRLNNYQSATFSAPLFYAASKYSRYLSLYNQEKYFLMQNIQKNNYYGSTLSLLVALKVFGNSNTEGKR